jgi:hypothetical protein
MRQKNACIVLKAVSVKARLEHSTLVATLLAHTDLLLLVLSCS